jgi:hypothetical protein
MDFVSLGWNAEAAKMCRERYIGEHDQEHEYLVGPFDDCYTNYEGICLCIKENFKFFFDVSYLTIIKSPFSSGNILQGERLIYNTRYNFVFPFESPDRETVGEYFIENNFEKFKERYLKRIDNFRDKLCNGAKITFCIGRFDHNTTELDAIIRKKYPELDFVINHFTPSSSIMLFDELHTIMKYRIPYKEVMEMYGLKCVH